MKLWRVHLRARHHFPERAKHFWLAASSKKQAIKIVKDYIDRCEILAAQSSHFDQYEYLNPAWMPYSIQCISSGKLEVETNWLDAHRAGVNAVQNLIKTMALVEDKCWEESQIALLYLPDHILRRHEQDGGRGQHSVASEIRHALSVLAEIDDDDDSSDIKSDLYNVYGSGGCNRWYFYGNGKIFFSVSHSTSNSATFTARMLGFELLNLGSINSY